MSNPIDPKKPSERPLDVVSERPGEGALPVPTSGKDAVFDAIQTSTPARVRPEILTAPPKPMDLLRALQRRWLLAFVLGCMLGIPAAVITWFVVPIEYTAEAFLQFNDEEVIIDAQSRSDGRRIDDPLQTHIQLIKSPFVINTALSEPGIADISWLKEVKAEGEDQVAWLNERIDVVNPRMTAVLRISMSGDEKEPVRMIVEAVAQAYLENVVRRERNDLLAKLSELERQHQELEADIGRRRKRYNDMVAEVDVFDGGQADANRELLMAEQKSLREEIGLIRIDILRQQLQISQLQRLEANDPEQVRQRLISNTLAADQQYGQLRGVVERLRDQEQEMMKLIKNPDRSEVMKRLREQIAEAEKDLAKREADVTLEIEEQEIIPPEVAQLNLLQNSLTATQEHLAKLQEQSKTLQQRINELTVFKPELERRKDELERLESVSNELGLRLQKLQLELSVQKPKVSLRGEATVPAMYDSSNRDRYTVLAALAGFGLAIVGVSLYEFQFRRLSSAHDMTEGLGMTVMGDVPLLSERPWRLPGMSGIDPISLQGMMDESVDSIRSLLLHSASCESVQVVMVTSANSGEGKTTISSSLAASLGRSGRRTLLIDGDMRRPAVHRMLDLPLDTGLSEVLRGEAAVEEAIRPSRAPGLWVMPAGRCDHESIQSLTKEILGATLEQLRAEFDIIVIDTGPVLSVVDPLLIGQHCDGAIVSVVRRVSQISNVYETCQRLQGTGIRLLGSVVNGVSGSQVSVGYYGYGYGYEDGYGREELSHEVAES